jgi:uncharacterized Tic20 family protein
MVGMLWEHDCPSKRGGELERHFLFLIPNRWYREYAMNDSDAPPPVPDPYSPPVVMTPMPPSTATALSSDERMWAMLGHLSALTGLLTGGIGYIAGPLIVWQVKKDTMPFAASESKEALNFNISWFIWLLVLSAVTVPLMLLLVGFFLLPVLIIFPVVWAIFCIVGALRANEGKPYRYPLTVRFIQ